MNSHYALLFRWCKQKDRRAVLACFAKPAMYEAAQIDDERKFTQLLQIIWYFRTDTTRDYPGPGLAVSTR